MDDKLFNTKANGRKTINIGFSAPTKPRRLSVSSHASKQT